MNNQINTKQNSTNSLKDNIKTNVMTNNKLKTNNKINNQPQTGYSGSNMFGMILLFVIVCIIGYSSYWLYNYYTTKTFTNTTEIEVLTDVTSANSNTSVSSSSIPSSSFSNEYSISFWINITDFNYNYGKEKVILRRGDKGAGNPEIVLGAKTNDLIVRVKLQGTTPTSMSSSKSSSSFIDIPLSLELNNNNYINSDLSSNDMNSIDYLDMYSTKDKAKAGKEHFNIVSNPDTVNFTNYNFKELINNSISSNNIDYPTIQYISDNPSLNNEYFKMISGNNINNNNNNNDCNAVEKFDNVTDAAKAIVLILTDLCDITTYLKTSQATDNFVDNITIVFTGIIDAIENLRTSLKANTTPVQTQYISKIGNSLVLSKNTLGLESKLNKLSLDVDNLKSFAGVVIDYNTLQSTVNAKMLEINCPLTFDGTTEIDGQLSFLENFIILLKDTLYTFLKNLSTSIKNNPMMSSVTGEDSDPTVGICIAKLIPQQKWVSVIVSVYNQVIDIYIDGQLSSSRVLKKFPDISTSSVNITPDGGFSGMISRVKFTNSAMTITEAKNIYYQGPIYTQSLFSMIPNWVYWTILAIVIIAVIYSFVM